MAPQSKYRRAVGIAYDTSTQSVAVCDSERSQDAPAVSLNVERLRADQVVALAHRYGIPVREDAELARVLAELEIDQRIPPELFEAVAAVLAELEQRTQPRSRTVPSSTR